MKKILIVAALMAAMMVSCGGNKASNDVKTNDSTVVDSCGIDSACADSMLHQ